MNELQPRIALIKEKFSFKATLLYTLSGSWFRPFGNAQEILPVRDGYLIRFSIATAPVTTIIWFSPDFSTHRVLIQHPGLMQMLYREAEQKLYFCSVQKGIGSDLLKGDLPSAFSDPGNSIIVFNLQGQEITRLRLGPFSHFCPFSLCTIDQNQLACYDLSQEKILTFDPTGNVLKKIPTPGLFLRNLKADSTGQLYFSTYSQANEFNIKTSEATENIYRVNPDQTLSLIYKSDLMGKSPFQLLDFQLDHPFFYLLTEKKFFKISESGEMVFQVLIEQLSAQLNGSSLYLMVLGKNNPEDRVFYSIGYVITSYSFQI